MPPSVICGLTCSVRPTSCRSNVLNAVTDVAVLAVGVAYEPVTTGTFWPTTIFASSLSSVIRLGVDRMLASADVDSACSKRAEPEEIAELVQQADVQALREQSASVAASADGFCATALPASVRSTMFVLPLPKLELP